jgi:hypothetical protein
LFSGAENGTTEKAVVIRSSSLQKAAFVSKIPA